MTELRSPWQFPLRRIFRWTLIIAVILAIGTRVRFEVMLLIGSTVAFATVGYWLHFVLKVQFWHTIFILVPVALLMMVMILPFLQEERGVSRGSWCSSNLKQIALALANYELDYGSLPPAIVTDNRGRPMHSWRVLLLPYLDRRDLYRRYDFSEPWDGPHNGKLQGEGDDIYACPHAQLTHPGVTSYLAIVGPTTAWPLDHARTYAEITDGLRSTILLVEVAGSGIHWMEPRDLELSRMAPGVNSTTGPGICSEHPGGAQVVMVDGSVRFLLDSTPEKTVQGLLTVAGGEKLATSDW